MASRIVTVTATPQLGPEPTETGLWCDHCALPTAVTWPIVGLCHLGGGPLGVVELGELTCCVACADPAAVVRDAVGRIRGS